MITIAWLCVVGIATTFPPVASPHAVGVEAKLKGMVLHVEGFYDDDSPAVGANVTVENEQGRTVAEGKTDDKGMWDLPAPPAGRYTVRLDAGAGHLAKVVVVVPPHFESTDDDGVTEGPERDEITGTGRAVIAVVFVAIIAGLTLLTARFAKSRRGAV